MSAPAVASRVFAQAGPDVLRIAQIEQVTNFDPALMSTQDMGVLIENPASQIDMITLFTPARIFDLHNYLDCHFNSKAWEYGRNFMYYENPEVDAALAQAAAALDNARARPHYRKVADLVGRDAPTIMIERLVGKMYTRKNIDGFYFNLKMYPTTVVFYDIRKK